MNKLCTRLHPYRMYLVQKGFVHIQYSVCLIEQCSFNQNVETRLVWLGTMSKQGSFGQQSDDKTWEGDLVEKWHCFSKDHWNKYAPPE
jgi:hypothetical protein